MTNPNNIAWIAVGNTQVGRFDGQILVRDVRGNNVGKSRLGTEADLAAAIAASERRSRDGKMDTI